MGMPLAFARCPAEGAASAADAPRAADRPVGGLGWADVT